MTDQPALRSFRDLDASPPVGTVCVNVVTGETETLVAWEHETRCAVLGSGPDGEPRQAVPKEEFWAEWGPLDQTTADPEEFRDPQAGYERRRPLHERFDLNTPEGLAGAWEVANMLGDELAEIDDARPQLVAPFDHRIAEAEARIEELTVEVARLHSQRAQAVADSEASEEWRTWLIVEFSQQPQAQKLMRRRDPTHHVHLRAGEVAWTEHGEQCQWAGPLDGAGREIKGEKDEALVKEALANLRAAGHPEVRDAVLLILKRKK